MRKIRLMRILLGISGYPGLPREPAPESRRRLFSATRPTGTGISPVYYISVRTFLCVGCCWLLPWWPLLSFPCCVAGKARGVEQLRNPSCCEKRRWRSIGVAGHRGKKTASNRKCRPWPPAHPTPLHAACDSTGSCLFPAFPLGQIIASFELVREGLSEGGRVRNSKRELCQAPKAASPAVRVRPCSAAEPRRSPWRVSQSIRVVPDPVG